MKKNSSFREKVIRVVKGIKLGETMTYKGVAACAGSPKAARAVGSILRSYFKYCVKNKKETIPCHRVVKSDGKPGGYAKGEREKKKLLKKEKAFQR